MRNGYKETLLKIENLGKYGILNRHIFVFYVDFFYLNNNYLLVLTDKDVVDFFYQLTLEYNFDSNSYGNLGIIGKHLVDAANVYFYVRLIIIFIVN